jgi:hypothetical protein
MLPFLILLLIGHHAVTRPGLLATPRKPASWPIPHHPRLAHFLPYLTGDSLGAINRAAVLRRLGRVWGIDQNGNCTLDQVVFILHWRRYRLQFPYVWTGTYTGTGRTRREKRVLVPQSWPRYFEQLTAEQASRLRQSPLGGRRPYRAISHMRLAAEKGIPWCLEGKGSPGLALPGTWDRLTGEALQTGVTCVFMVLTSWPNWQAEVRQALDHGWAVAVLPRTSKPANWPELHAAGVQVWGTWR